MPAGLIAPFGDLESLGIGKETTFGTFATPTTFYAFNQFDPKPQNVTVARTAARKHYGQARPATAGYEATATLDAEFDPDVIAQIIAYGFGGQSTPTLDIFASTLSAATTIGANSFSVVTTAAMVNDPGFLIPGQKVTIDTAANLETLTVQTVTPSDSVSTPSVFTTTTNAAFAHASGVATVVTATNAYLSTFSMSTLPSFSIELNRITDAVRYLGCMVDTMDFTATAKKGVDVKIGLVYQNEFVTTPGACTTPTYSTKLPLMFEHPANLSIMNGAVMGQFGQVTVQSFSIKVNNNLMKGYYSFGQGRQVQSFPQQLRTISGTVGLGFETDAAYLAFLGAATGPNPITVPEVAVAFSAVGSDIIDTGTNTPFSFRFILPNNTIDTHAVANQSTKVLMQTFNLKAAESLAGANDDMKIAYIGSSSTVF